MTSAAPERAREPVACAPSVIASPNAPTPAQRLRAARHATHRARHWATEYQDYVARRLTRARRWPVMR